MIPFSTSAGSGAVRLSRPGLALVSLGALGLTLALPAGLIPVQAQPSPPLAQAAAVGGNTLIINGVRLTVPWMVRGDEIGVADYGLTTHLGLTLLNTDNPDRQPVQWFSNPATGPLVLPAWVAGGYRYLALTPLMDRYGWTLTPQGPNLTLQTPAALVQAVQGDPQRLVVDLTAPAPVQVLESGETLTVTLGASPSPTLAQDPKAPALTTPGNQSRLTLPITPGQARPRVTTQASPPRLVVEVRPDYLRPLDIQWAAGLRWRQQMVAVGGRSFPVFWLELTPGQAGLNLRPIWADPTTATGTAPLVTIAPRWQAAAALNAGFFNRNNQYPLGAVRYNQEWISGPILNRGVVGWSRQGQVAMDRLSLQQTLVTGGGQSFPIKAINSGYVGAGIGLYTPAWGRQYRPILDNETVITVVDQRVVQQQAATPTTAIAIPSQGYLLAVRSYTTAVQTLGMGTAVRVDSTLTPDHLQPFPEMVGGGPLLIKNRSIVLNADLEEFSQAFATQAAPRSAIGLTATGQLLLVAVHHSPAGPGPTLAQLAQIMAQLGAVDALNLDGGSSASLYLGGQLINRPPGTAARVNNGIGVFVP
ncbi:MAG: phosphodiester glycosidase family protein [Cyanobacteriota bacterium]|nr:phosphodiester glycosidase family protein [Cyanobacteriota bacterium]